MTRIALLLVGLAGAGLASTPARADATAGAALAQRWCSNCHVINGSSPSATAQQGPPSFRTIKGHLDAGQIRTFLSQPHGAMPALALSRAEIEDLTAYIESVH